MPYRVIQWYTGSIAREQIRLIQRHSELELVGAVVHHEDKVGRDVGEIAAGETIGVRAIGSADDALKLEADGLRCFSRLARAQWHRLVRPGT